MKALRRIVGLKLYTLALMVEPEITIALRQHVERAVQARVAAEWSAFLTDHRRKPSQIAQSN